jgi:TetR/AcrR family tetracycline transcriptional repressor
MARSKQRDVGERQEHESRPRGRPPKITRDEVIGAAIDLGLDTFTMHGVAARLGVAPPTLYSHVRDRDDLVEIALHSQLDGFAIPDQSLAWREWLTRFALEHRRHATALGFPSVIARHDLIASGRLEITESALGVLTAAGFSDAQAGLALWVVFRTACAHPPQSGQFDRQLTETHAALDDETAPTYERVAGAMHAVRSVSPDERFAFELDVILDGLSAQLAAR